MNILCFSVLFDFGNYFRLFFGQSHKGLVCFLGMGRGEAFVGGFKGG